MDFGHTLPVLKRLHQVLHAHLEVQPLLGGDIAVAIEAVDSLVDLFLQYVLVEQHDNHVVEVVAGAGIEQDAHNVAEVVQLVLGEELVVQVKAAEDHVHLRHIVVVTCEERVVQGGELGTRWIEQPQLVQASGAVNVRQQLFEEFEVSLAVEDDHRDVVTILRWPNETRNILGDDVFEQSGLPRSGHAEHNALHHAHFIRPKPGRFVHVVAEQHGILVPGGFDCTLIFARRDDKRRTFVPLAPRGEVS